MIGPDDTAALPTGPGAYALLIALAEPLALDVPRPGKVLPPGRYVYLGSARGPGGIRARVSRHLKREKAVRWHVDRLTLAAASVTAAVWPDGDECAWRRRLHRRRGVTVPLKGFGSSDCRACPAHLLALAPDAPAEELLSPPRRKPRRPAP